MEPSEPPAEPSEPPAEDRLYVVPVLFVHATLDGDALERPELVWNAVAADELAQREAAIAGIDGHGTATLAGADGQLLAEAPAAVHEQALTREQALSMARPA